MTNPEQKPDPKKQMTFKKSLMFSLEFGFMIALPLVIFAFIGNKLADRYNNRFYLIAGLILALVTSCIWFMKKIKEIYDDFLN